MLACGFAQACLSNSCRAHEAGYRVRASKSHHAPAYFHFYRRTSPQPHELLCFSFVIRSNWLEALCQSCCPHIKTRPIRAIAEQSFGEMNFQVTVMSLLQFFTSSVFCTDMSIELWVLLDTKRETCEPNCAHIAKAEISVVMV